jgi:hypothetical protein
MSQVLPAIQALQASAVRPVKPSAQAARNTRTPTTISATRQSGPPGWTLSDSTSRQSPATRRLRRRSRRPPDSQLLLVMPGVLALDFGIPAQVFAEDPHHDLVVCAETGSPVSSSGFAITAPARLDALDRANTVIVPGYRGIDAPVSQPVVDALRAAHARGARLVSICSGAFALGRSGSVRVI